MINTQMTKVKTIKKILIELGVDSSNMTCYILLTALNIFPKSNWASATNNWIKRRDVIDFVNKYYHTNYAYTTGEDVMKKISYLKAIGIIEENDTAPNSPYHAYRIKKEFLKFIQTYKLKGWTKTKKRLTEKYNKRKTRTILRSNKKNYLNTKIGNKTIKLESSLHGQTMKEVIESYLPTRIPHGICIHIDDTKKQGLYSKKRILKELKIDLTEHGIRPDMIVHDKKKNTIYFIEIVTSSGVITEERVQEIKNITTNCTCKIKFINVFPDSKTRNKFIDKAAPGTYIWANGESYIKEK